MADNPIASPGLHKALVRHTGFLINKIGMVARKRFSDRLESLGLNFGMWGVLNVLDVEGEITQHALGKCVGIDPSSMVATIDELEASGLVERGRHPTDRRAHAVRMTDRGRETLTRGRELAREAQEELLSPLSAKERKQFHEMLLRVALHTEEARQQEDYAGTAATS